MSNHNSIFFFSSRRRHTRFSRDWSSDVCSSDLTGVGFVAGVAMDPVHHELFTVNNDVEDRLVVFDYDDRGNVKPKRLLYVPHQSWGIAFAPKRDVIALSVQTPNMFVVFRRDANKFDAPVRSVRGPKTQMADPHGIYFDETHNEVRSE